MNASAPFFSWTCLFPDDTSYRCASHTDWAREACASRGGKGNGSRVFVTAGQALSDFPDLTSYAGLAALNCQGLSDRRLLQAGFTYVRRFAVLPDARRSRWFIPLDTPAVSVAAFCLCAPFRAAAQLRHHGCRAAARLGLPLWYRDELCIAQRVVPPVERVVASLFPGRSLRLALSSGTPPPAINRKLSLAVLAPGGRVLAFAKLPGPCPASDHNVRHEAEVLAQLAVRQQGARAPRVVFAGDIGARYLAVFTPLQGQPPCPEPADGHRRFLDNLRTNQLRPAGDTVFARSLDGHSRLLDGRPMLRELLGDLLALLRALRVPATTVHGDFVPWNLRQHRGDIAAFDWEYAQFDGLPLIDETHHLLAVGYLLKRWTPEHACRRLLEVASAAPLGLTSRAVRALQLSYLLDYVLRLFREGHGDDYPRVAWCRQIIERLAPAALRGAAA
jgi:hypothetical protein